MIYEYRDGESKPYLSEKVWAEETGLHGPDIPPDKSWRSKRGSHSWIGGEILQRESSNQRLKRRLTSQSW